MGKALVLLLRLQPKYLLLDTPPLLLRLTSQFSNFTRVVFDSSECGTTLDHAVTAVGYGTENVKEYYLVKNSWGPNWGDQGYIKIRTETFGIGYCGIQQRSYRPYTN